MKKSLFNDREDADNFTVSIVIPAFNEEKTITPVLNNLKSLDEKYEIIVVDDGSGDNTAKIIGDQQGVYFIRHDHNLGYGAALKTGIEHASGDAILIMDADGTYPYAKIPELVKTLREGGYDMVVGARTGGHVKIPLSRRPAKWLLNRLADYLSETKIPDLNSGMRVIKRSAIMKFIRLLPNGFSFTTTITLAMLTNGHPVRFIPINYYAREGKSKIRPVRDTLNFIQLIIRTVMYFNPLKIFIPFSFCIVLLAFTLLFASWILLGKPMDVSFGVMLMAAVIILAIGMLADLIDKRVQ